MKRLLFLLILGLMPLAYGQQVNPVTGNITASSTDCSTANSCVSIGLAPNTGTVAIDLTGSGPFSGTVQFEGVICSTGAVCGTWASLSCTPPGSTTGVTSATATGAWRCAVSALTKVRVRGSAYSSGTAAITITASPTSASLGGGGGGTAPGAANDIAGYASTGSQVAPLATGVFTYNPSTGAEVVKAGGSIGSADTGTPTLTFGTNSESLNQPLSFTSSGAGFAGFTQGTDNSAACPAQAFCVEGATGITQAIMIWPSIPGSGALDVSSDGGSPPKLTAFFSGDSNHATLQKTESAADTNVLTLTPPATTGTYRLTISGSVSAANTATLGWTATWKDANGSARSPTNLPVALASTGTYGATTGAISAADDFFGSFVIDIDNSATNIVIKLTFSGTSFAAKVSAHIERI